MKMLFHANEISETGTSTAMIEYALWFAKKGNHVEVAFDKLALTNDSNTILKFRENFEVHPYESFELFLSRNRGRFDFAYFIKPGYNDGKLFPGALNCVHSVFQNYDPHGDKYAYVSKWIATMMARDQNELIPKYLRRKVPNFSLSLPYVPHFVTLPTKKLNLRKVWGVPEDAFVVLRYGGYEKFDIPWVHRVVHEFVIEHSNVYFVFINTRPFALHHQIIYLPAVVEKSQKADALGSADVFLHARAQGESFGMAILEAMSAHIPVLSWKGGVDRAHSQLLEPDCFYTSDSDLKGKLFALMSGEKSSFEHSRLAEYSESEVMQKFESVFLG